MSETSEKKEAETELLPFVAPHNKLAIGAAFTWLKLGFQDFKTAPKTSLIYGGGLMLISYVLTIASWNYGGAVLLLSLLSGLVFVAPALALGLYSVSCQIAAGRTPKLGYCLREGKRHLGNELIFSLVLLIIFLLWARSGSVMHIFFPVESETNFSDYVIFYGIGSIVGAIFASIVFCASAFSLPMMMDRKADAITAVLTSVNAVLDNKPAMFVWALVIVGTIAICFLTAFLAMPVLFPVLGYATWHGYKQTIDAHLWQENDKLSDSHPDVDHIVG